MLARQDVKIGGLNASCFTSQGGRKYMEDCFNVAYDCSLHGYGEYAFFGVFDGHGGPEASIFARDFLKRSIIQQKLFWSDNDDDVLRAIRQGFIATHYAMWRAQDKWPKTSKGFPSTSGTTASVAFYKNNKLYIGHVGDSGIALGYQEEGEKNWRAHQLTQDHKPECNIEKARIINSGGKVVIKSGVPRIVWNRPRIGHKGPVRRSTPIDEIPFLAVARSLGDLWSYNSSLNKFVVSPDPDVHVIPIDRKKFRCLVFGTDGLWNVVTAEPAVNDVKTITETLSYHPDMECTVSQYLVEGAILRWEDIKMRADNICVLVVTVNSEGEKSPYFPSPLKRKLSMNLKESPCSSSINSHNFYDSMWNENCQSSTSNMIHNLTRYDRPGEDLGYMNSFAESYNLLYENSLYNMRDDDDHESAVMRHQTTNGEDMNFNTETYSLTKLQTRSEQINSLNFHGIPYFFNNDDSHVQNRSHQCDTSILNSLEIILPLVEDEGTKSHNRTLYHDAHQHHHNHATRSIQINEITSSSIANDDEYIHSSSSGMCSSQPSDSSNNVLLENNLVAGPMNSNLVIIKKQTPPPEPGLITSRNRVVSVTEHPNNLRTRRQKLVSLYKLGPPVTRSKDLLYKKKLLINGSGSTKSVQAWAKKKKDLKLRKSTVQSVIKPSKKQQQNTNSSSNNRNNTNMTSSNNSSRYRTCKYLKAIKSPKNIHLLIHPIKNN